MKNANTAPLVILGLGDDKKPRAARFDAAQGEAVRKAAALMGLRVGTPKTPEATELATKLTAGKLFAAGRGLVPLVKQDIYIKLTEKLELEPAPSAAPSKDASAPATAGQAKPSAGSNQAVAGDAWASLKVGSTVIVEESPALGWWKAVITSVSKDGTKVNVRWVDAPKQPQVTVKRHAVALLYPG